MKRKNFFGILTVMLISAATVSFYGCKDDNGGDDTPPDTKTDPSTIAAANLIAYWNFEDKATDEIGSKGTASDAVTYVTGRRGKAYQGADKAFINFDVSPTDKFATMTSYTIAAWIKAPVIKDGVAGNAPGMLFQISGKQYAGALGFFQEAVKEPDYDKTSLKMMFSKSNSDEWIGQTWIETNSAFLVNKWFHVAHVYDPITSKASIYVNGKLLMVTNKGLPFFQSNPGTTFNEDETVKVLNPNGAKELGNLKLDINDSNNKGMIGGWYEVEYQASEETWRGYYKGLLDELRIYNRTLTAAEIQSLYDAEVSQIN